MMLLYAATSNEGKLRDFAYAAERHAGRFIIEPLPGLSSIAAPPEDESTFEANARAKAAYYSRYAPGAIVIADDSGLEVVGLGGAPGVRSARYADDKSYGDPRASVDDRNNEALLHALEAVPGDGRKASYRCVLALARDGHVLRTAEGRLDGTILSKPRGTAGFGYDPLFLLPDYNLTMAEIESALRIQVSHRGRALEGLLRQLESEWPDIARFGR
jgi:XTP/dITP diphosphohydrolase